VDIFYQAEEKIKEFLSKHEEKIKEETRVNSFGLGKVEKLEKIKEIKIDDQKILLGLKIV